MLRFGICPLHHDVALLIKIIKNTRLFAVSKKKWEDNLDSAQWDIIGKKMQEIS